MKSVYSTYSRDLALAIPFADRAGSRTTERRRARHVPATREYLMLQVCLCAAPTSALLATGRVAQAGICFWLALGVCLLRLFVFGKSDQVLCLILAVSPFVNLLRQTAFYNVVVALLVFALVFCYLKTPDSFRLTFRKFRFAVGLLVYLTLYYSISFAVTHDYTKNLRMFELGLVVIMALIISRRASLLGSSLRGLAICAIALGASMLPHLGSVEDSRLGEIDIYGQSLGNPILLGLPLALSFLALSVEKGRWVNLQRRHLYRFSLLGCNGILLALTTSRVSWLVVVCGIAITLVLGARQRTKMLLVIGVAGLAVQVVMFSSFDERFQRGVQRTLGEERTVTNRTSGRSEQWVVAYYAFTDSIGSVLHGYGPGTGRDIYAAESRRVPGIEFMVGRRMELHSFIMQVGVETGLLGLVPFLIWMFAAAFRIRRWTAKSRLCFPMVCFCSYVLIIATVSGHDITSGFFVGIGLLASSRVPRAINPVRSRARLTGSLSPRSAINLKG